MRPDRKPGRPGAGQTCEGFAGERPFTVFELRHAEIATCACFPGANPKENWYDHCTHPSIQTLSCTHVPKYFGLPFQVPCT